MGGTLGRLGPRSAVGTALDGAVSLERHNVIIQETRECWERKPLLRKIYAQFYREISRCLNPDVSGLIVELGSGMGNIKEHIPQAVTTDVFPNPWLDRVENAYALSFGQGELGHLIMFDVWHHLQYPGTALQEFARVLAPDGRIIIFDPAMGLMGRFIFGNFHDEPLGLEQKIEWEAPDGFTASESTYYAAQGNASRVFGTEEFRDELQKWRIVKLEYFSGVGYLGSGGFRGPQLYPTALWPLFRQVDSALSRFPRLASRMLVVLERSE